MLPTRLVAGRASTTGWIGLGAMGHHMALNLFSKTFLAHQAASNKGEAPSYLICEQDDTRADNFIAALRNRAGSEVSDKIHRVGSGREIAINASRIMTMLPSTPQVESVYLDSENGILPALKSIREKLPPLTSPETSQDSAGTIHTLLIDGTTLDPTAAKRIAQTVQEETGGGAVMLDAPVSGGIVGAEAGTLTIMFGSPSSEATALASPLLQTMAREGGVIACGGNGTGVGVKVANNLILAINQIGLAEGLALGKSLGVEPLLLHNVINGSSGQSWSSKVNSPLKEVPNSPGSRNFTGGFQSRLMLKDVGLALSAAHAVDLPTPLTWAAKSVYDAVCQEGDGAMGSKDFSVVLQWLLQKRDEGVERGWKDGKPDI